MPRHQAASLNTLAAAAALALAKRDIKYLRRKAALARGNARHW